MEKLLVLLEQNGSNPRVGIEAMLGDEEMYLRLLKEFLRSNEIIPLEKKIEDGDYICAFRICHKMKGSSVTLALTPLSTALSQLTELLRPFYNGIKKIDGREDAEERPLIMLAFSRAKLMLDRYSALLDLAEM